MVAAVDGGAGGAYELKFDGGAEWQKSATIPGDAGTIGAALAGDGPMTIIALSDGVDTPFRRNGDGEWRPLVVPKGATSMLNAGAGRILTRETRSSNETVIRLAKVIESEEG